MTFGESCSLAFLHCNHFSLLPFFFNVGLLNSCLTVAAERRRNFRRIRCNLQLSSQRNRKNFVLAVHWVITPWPLTNPVQTAILLTLFRLRYPDCSVAKPQSLTYASCWRLLLFARTGVDGCRARCAAVIIHVATWMSRAFNPKFSLY